MQNAVCKDGRAHGMFQFYGANRSGRWAGRLIQLQNLPQNHMNDLADARELVRTGDYDSLELLYSSSSGSGTNLNTEELILLTADFSICPSELSVPISSCKKMVTFFCARVIAVYNNSIDNR